MLLLFFILLQLTAGLIFFIVTHPEFFEYKIVYINESILTLTKGQFHKKEYVYKRDHLTNMPWVAINNTRPNPSLSHEALIKHKLNIKKLK